MIKIGDKLRFKKFNWVITKLIKHPSGVVEYRYRVYRKYFGALIPLTNTKCNYFIYAWRWEFLKERLKENKNYNYNMSLWSNAPRRKNLWRAMQPK